MDPKGFVFKKSWYILLVLGLALLLPATVALATFVSIDTNNNVIDAVWSTVSVFQQKIENPAIPNAYEIKQTWVSREADNSFWYFRADLFSQLPTDNYSSVEVRIDCNDDGAFTSSQDKIGFYYHAALTNNMDNVIECAGNNYPLCSTDGESKGWDFGEGFPVGDGTYSYEWKMDTNEFGGIDWSTCTGQRLIQFVTVDNLGNIVDSTPPRLFDVPTVVKLTRLSATYNRETLLTSLLGLALLLGAAIIWLHKRSQRSEH